MNQYNALHGNKPTEPPIDCNSHPPKGYLKYHNSATKNSPIVSVITGNLNHHVVDKLLLKSIIKITHQNITLLL